MEKHIQVEEASLLWHELPCFYKDNQYEGLSKQSNSRNESSWKKYEGPTHGF
jgi:hypothetical protein